MPGRSTVHVVSDTEDGNCNFEEHKMPPTLQNPTIITSQDICFWFLFLPLIAVFLKMCKICLLDWHHFVCFQYRLCFIHYHDSRQCILNIYSVSHIITKNLCLNHLKLSLLWQIFVTEKGFFKIRIPSYVWCLYYNGSCGFHYVYTNRRTEKEVGCVSQHSLEWGMSCCSIVRILSVIKPRNSDLYIASNIYRYRCELMFIRLF